MMFSLFGLGKPRSSFGKFLDKNDISQQDLVRWSGVNKTTISKICSGDAFTPSVKNTAKIIRALRRHGYDVDFGDFWDL